MVGITYTILKKAYLYKLVLKRTKMKSALEIKPDISYKSAGKFEKTRFEKIYNEIFKNSTEAL
jgi:glucosamine-6-phosphate deaminase